MTQLRGMFDNKQLELTTIMETLSELGQPPNMASLVPNSQNTTIAATTMQAPVSMWRSYLYAAPAPTPLAIDMVAPFMAKTPAPSKSDVYFTRPMIKMLIDPLEPELQVVLVIYSLYHLMCMSLFSTLLVLGRGYNNVST